MKIHHSDKKKQGGRFEVDDCNFDANSSNCFCQCVLKSKYDSLNGYLVTQSLDPIIL